MSAVLKHELALRWVDCFCGITFAVPQNFHDAKYKSGGTFFCPNGHSLGWSQSEADRVRSQMGEQLGKTQKELENARQRLEFARHDAEASRQQRDVAERRLSAAKGQITRIKRRGSNGVCPCCRRSFVALARHMKTKHPDYSK